MKKIKDWFQELPEPQRSMAMNNYNLEDDSFCAMKLSYALKEGFVWAATDEGHTYWEIFVKEIEADEFRENRREDWQWEADNISEFED
jgi:hypothetical protein